MLENSSKFGFGICKPRYNMLDAYLPNSKFGFKKTGEPFILSSYFPYEVTAYTKLLFCFKWNS